MYDPWTIHRSHYSRDPYVLLLLDLEHRPPRLRRLLTYHTILYWLLHNLPSVSTTLRSPFPPFQENAPPKEIGKRRND